jgi:ferrous iron transport protein A
MRLNDTNLSQMKPGEPARIVDIGGGHGIRQKLNLRGISEGSIVRVISTNGPVTIEVDRNVLSIGRGMAQKIRVTRM